MIQLTRLIKITSGGRHAWYETADGFPVRKPFLPIEQATPTEQTPIAAPSLSFWQKVKAWFYSLFK